MQARCRLSLVSVVAAIVVCASLPSVAEPLLRSGDRMVFLGDSITQQRGYTRYVMDYFALRYPELKVTFRNCGVSGDTAAGALKRLEGDVLSFRPTVVSISFGMNDAGYAAFDQARYDAYIGAMSELIDRLQTAGLRVVTLTPGCVDPDRKEEAWYDPSIYNPVLARYAQGVVDLAFGRDLPFYDVYHVMLDVQTRAKAADPSFTMIPDSVHPDARGQFLMAYGLLKAMGCDRQPSGLEIDAAARRATPDRCKVENLAVTDTQIRFTRTDEALPTYFDPAVRDIFPYVPIVLDMELYPFRVTGLRSGSWHLTVASFDVGAFSADELARGVNLALAPGPWAGLAKQVNDSVDLQEGICLWERRINGYLSCPPGPALPPETEPERLSLARKLDEVIDARAAAMRRMVSERRWDWSLTLQP